MSVLSIFKKKSFYIILILVLAMIGYSIYVKIANDRFEASDENPVEVSTEEIGDIGRDDTYALYLDNYKEATRPEAEIVVDLLNYSASDKVEALKEYEGEDNVLVSQEDGFVEWTITVPEAGLYNFYMRYYPIASKGIDIERALYINGEIPFSGADTLTFSRVWTDGEEITQDNRGNEIRPSQKEAPRWEATYFKDFMGYQVEPYEFYLKEGENVIRFEATSEPVAISDMVIGQVADLLSYDEYIAGYELNLYQNTELEYFNKVQGEDATFRSSPTLYANFDRASSNTEPYSASKIKLNNIGGDAWRVAGQWIEWDVTVPEDGLYNISFKSRQNYNRGMVSNRKVYIDGVTPFEEAATLQFRYSTEWKLYTLEDEEGTPYQIPLTKGTHTIRLEVSLGDLGKILNQIEDSVYRLNAMYRKILVVTGTKPDAYRDYRIDKIYPEVITAMAEEADYLDDIVVQLTEYTGQKGSETAVADNLAKQLQRFTSNPDAIPRTMENFKQNISSLGTSILNLSNSQLDVDFVYVCADGGELPNVDETFFGKVGHELKSFVASFFEDYSTLGNVYEGGEVLDVWLLSGRDQSTILKSMIDDTFTPETGIGVNVKLVSADTLLPAVVAGTGPDIALTVTGDVPVNYALRGASCDLTQFVDFEEVTSEYYEEALVPFEFEGGIYGLPETQNFNVMFYRTDILEDIGVELPETWEEVIALLPVLQKNNMQFAIPSTERVINNQVNPDYSAMLSLVYQYGGQLYSEDASRCLLDAERSVAAFEFYTRLYTHYGLPQKYDFVNRFRSGEMPIGIADYVNYNTLSVFAPEIRGLWDFALVPGVKDEKGNINRDIPSWGSASMILDTADDKDAAWTFLKWWASSETNVRYARELESLMGSSARYATANKVAFDQLAWSTDNKAIMEEQWKSVIGIPQVAGGYYTTRHMINAFRRVTYDKEDARETLLDYTRTINEEIENKRAELGLSDE
jgi:ABC-type glycerol-3-phosphate transport system substrate-binding protein